MKEQWKEIKGNREIYEVSSLGNVRTKDRDGGNMKTGELARNFNVNPQTITDIVSERIWRSIL